MDAEGRGNFDSVDESRSFNVRRDHALLDQLVRIIPLQHPGLRHRAGVIQHKTYFRRLKLNRTTGGAGGH